MINNKEFEALFNNDESNRRLLLLAIASYMKHCYTSLVKELRLSQKEDCLEIGKIYSDVAEDYIQDYNRLVKLFNSIAVQFNIETRPPLEKDDIRLITLRLSPPKFKLV